MDISMIVFGDFACFTPGFAKVERMSSPFPTPSAARGILSAIYNKPKEFYWVVKRIEVLKPIRYISFKRNEVKSTISNKPIYTDEDRTQRQTVALRDVCYRLVAEIVPRPGFEKQQKGLEEQALRRIREGKCYYQPSLGLREFVAYFESDDGSVKPISEDLDGGLMTYDVFDYTDPDGWKVTKNVQPKLTLYHAVMRQGVINVPPFESA